jgi:hypothetical protein
VRQYIPIEGIGDGIVKVGEEHALPQIVEHYHPDCTTQPPEGLLM